MVSGDMAMYRRILFALCLAAMLPGSGHAQNEASAPPAGPAPIATLQQELREAGFDPGPVNGVMSEKTTRALVAYERRMKRLPQAIASVGVDAADPVLLAQKGLQQLGFYSGPMDGALGPGTRDAIIRFEVSRHLPVDPRVSDRLLAALVPEGAAPAANAPAPPPTTAAAPPAVASAPSAPPAQAAAPPTPATPAPQVATGAAGAPAMPQATGRQALPSWVNPPPIR
jgi:peptidoglycan hydrolase-like protein with peptidoglycan-binding domain